MKTLATLFALLFLFASCATNDGFIDNESTLCREGSEIELRVGFADQSAPAGTTAQNLTLMVEITNLTQDEVTVDNVQAEPLMGDPRSRSRFELQGGSRDVNKTVAEGDSTVVEVPMTVRRRDLPGYPGPNARPPHPSDEVNAVFELSVTVRLEGGATHRCRFRVPATF